MIPVILSGGSGSRLWPISRASYPKQFCDIFDEPLLSKTLRRLSPWGEPLVVTVKSLDVLTEKGLKSLGFSSSNVLYEPFSKNTAPAIALLCWQLAKQGQAGEVAGVFPADHMISKEDEFKKVIEFAAKCAAQGPVVTIGIQPDYPATGFGYIECAEAAFQDNGLEAKKVKGFREKPNLQTATKFVEEKNFFWNAGMFIFRVDVMIQAFKKHLPAMWEQMEKLHDDLSNLKEVYEAVEAVSIDFGIMEKIDNQMCIPCDIGWSDLGSWDDFAKMIKQSGENTPPVELVEVGCENNFVFSLKEKTVGLVGVQDLIIVETPDALLIAKKGQSQNIKSLVDDLNARKSTKAKDHTFDFRPWGKYEIISDTDDYKIKVISVNANSQLSYQSHVHRAEHWVVIEGEGEVILNEQGLEVRPGSSIVIPQNSKHRIRNTSNKTLRFVEVQTGDYFGEEDITRYADDYKRAPKT